MLSRGLIAAAMSAANSPSPKPTGGGGGGSEPGLTVADRTDGEAYTVAAGARSLSVSNPDSAVLNTTVEKASDGSAVTVAGATGTTPSWTAPSGSTTGEAVQVRVTATKGGLSTSVAFTERIAGAGGAGSWSTKSSHDITGATNAGPYTSGAHTVDATGGSIGMTATRASGNSGNVTITDDGAVVTAAGGSGAMTATYDLGAALAGYDFEYIRFAAIAVDVHITNIVFDDDGSIGQIAISDSTAWNDGDGRGLELYQADASDEQRRIRGAGSTTTIDTRTKVTERVVTLVMTRGQIIDFADTSGTTAPADPHTASPLYTAGGDAVGRNDDTPLYITNFFLNVTAFGAAALTCTKIVVRRFE